MDHTIGALAPTVKSFTIMLADGSIEKVTPQNNPELFNVVIGGYGLFGIILDVELEVTDNVMYERDMEIINYTEFPEFFEDAMKNNRYDLFYAHLSTSPISFLQQMLIYGYKKVHDFKKPLPSLRKVSFISIRRFLLNLSKVRWYAQMVKWFAEKYIDPYIAMPLRGPFISRNEIMHDSVEYLENVIANETDILQEYFIPGDRFINFITSMRTILQERNIAVLNASVRIVHRESIMLNYAPQDMFAIVLYLNQRVNHRALENMKALTQELINLTLQLNGTFFLPYQLYFTKEQLCRAYPSIDTFFKLKRKYDPDLLFINNFYERYA